MSPKSVEEVDALKLSWLKDPCWDIEETEGFEDHKEELLAFRKKIEKEAHARVEKLNEEKKDWLGGHDPLHLVGSITLPFDIEATMAGLDSQVKDWPWVNFEIGRAMVRTNLLIAIQLKRIAQVLEDMQSDAEDESTARLMSRLYDIKK